jgi:hypothetical protein
MRGLVHRLGRGAIRPRAMAALARRRSEPLPAMAWRRTPASIAVRSATPGVVAVGPTLDSHVARARHVNPHVVPPRRGAGPSPARPGGGRRGCCPLSRPALALSVMDASYIHPDAVRGEVGERPHSLQRSVSGRCGALQDGRGAGPQGTEAPPGMDPSCRSGRWPGMRGTGASEGVLASPGRDRVGRRRLRGPGLPARPRDPGAFCARASSGSIRSEWRTIPSWTRRPEGDPAPPTGSPCVDRACRAAISDTPISYIRY